MRKILEEIVYKIFTKSNHNLSYYLQYLQNVRFTKKFKLWACNVPSVLYGDSIKFPK